MNDDVLAIHKQGLRGTDDNSLLRLYDLNHGRWHHLPPSQERVRLGKAVERIAQELQRRNLTH